MYSVQQASQLNVSCLGSTGSVAVLILGMGFEIKDSSIRCRNHGFHLTSSERSQWHSDTSIEVKQGGRSSQSIAISLPGAHSESLKSPGSFCSLPNVTFLQKYSATTGGAIIFIQSVSSGQVDFTLMSRIGNTATLATYWISDSFISTRMFFLSHWSVSGFVLSVDAEKFVSSSALVLVKPFIVNSSQVFASSTGGQITSFSGLNFGACGSSARFKFSSTTVGESKWISDSSTHTKFVSLNQARVALTMTLASVIMTYPQIIFNLSLPSIR